MTPYEERGDMRRVFTTTVGPGKPGGYQRAGGGGSPHARTGLLSHELIGE